MSAKAVSSGTPSPTEDKLTLLRRAGEVLCEARSFEELDRYMSALREGIGASRKTAIFAPLKLSFERRGNAIESRPEHAPAARRVCRQTGGRLVRVGTLIPAALAGFQGEADSETPTERDGGTPCT